MSHYFLALVATIVVEALVLALLVDRPDRRRVVLASVFVNCLTHPIASALNVGPLAIFAAVELAVVVTEAWLYSRVVPARFARALGWSVAANVPTIALSFWV